jgi:hypothetical protein
MRYLLFAFLIGTLAVSCKKQSKENSWLDARKQELSSCVCLTKIMEGKYHNETVYEIRLFDPLCNGVHVAHKADGTQIVHSGEQAAYQAYLNEVQDLHEIWRCSKSQTH